MPNAAELKCITLLSCAEYIYGGRDDAFYGGETTGSLASNVDVNAAKENASANCNSHNDRFSQQGNNPVANGGNTSAFTNATVNATANSNDEASVTSKGTSVAEAGLISTEAEVDIGVDRLGESDSGNEGEAQQKEKKGLYCPPKPNNSASSK